MNSFDKLKIRLYNYPGWKTIRKILVIHSDDWGSIRMPSKEVYNKSLNIKTIGVNNPYNKYDTLASPDDLIALYEVLSSFKDQHSNTAKLTANCVVCNPDFERIEHDNFDQYYHEELKQTFAKYNNSKALDLWFEGLEKGLFYPQFHGREHVNVNFWLNYLKKGHKGVRFAFDHGYFGANFEDLSLKKTNFQASWDFNTVKENELVNESIIEGMNIFQQTFGYVSETIIAPSYTWSDSQENLLHKLGALQMQGIMVQKIPSNSANYKRRFRFTSNNGRILGYQMRNAFFEPTLIHSNDSISNVIKRIDIAFNSGKPAIIGSHRLNFIGVHHEENRAKTLMQLKQLLKHITKKYPDIEFMSAAELAKAMNKS